MSTDKPWNPFANPGVCDLCRARAADTALLHHPYQAAGVETVCFPCRDRLNAKLAAIRKQNGRRMRRFVKFLAAKERMTRSSKALRGEGGR